MKYREVMRDGTVLFDIGYIIKGPAGEPVEGVITINLSVNTPAILEMLKKSHSPLSKKSHSP